MLETADVHWVAQKVTTGCRNISNCLSIGSNFDKKSPDVVNFAKEQGFWNGEVSTVHLFRRFEFFFFILNFLYRENSTLLPHIVKMVAR